MPTLYAIADLHLSYPLNRTELSHLTPRPNDSLILAGDLGETPEHLHLAFSSLAPLYKTLYWVPGNHELYTLPSSNPALRGEAKYADCVAIARSYGVLTPEDDFSVWEGRALICPIFTLYDYSFRPDDVRREDALRWAEEKDIVATDEALLHADPYGTRDEWCEALVAKFEARLEIAARKARMEGLELVIVNHWPLKGELAFLPAVPRFTLWCGTKRTEDWGSRFGARVVVSGHIHIRRTDWIQGVRFEEVSLGYPRQWKEAREEKGMGIQDLMREILPGPERPGEGIETPTLWRRCG